MGQTNILRRTFERIRPHMSPSLIVIGAQKAGTSALFTMLARHPKAAPPKVKELDFFSDDASYAKGMGHYRTLFPAIPVKSFGHFTFEASPSYLFDAEICAPRIAKNLPDVPCLAILRDPVKRAYSAWNMNRDFKRQPKHAHLHDSRSFLQAVEDEIAGRTLVRRHCYLLRSMYSGQLAEFMKVIPPDRLLIRSFLELKRNPEHVLTELFLYLGLEPFPTGHEVFDVRANVRPYQEQLDPGLAKELYQYFIPELKRLREIVGHDMDLLEDPTGIDRLA